MTSIGLIYTTFETAEQAKEIVLPMLESGDIKCMNIFAPHEAVYIWDGEMRAESEVVALLKLPQDKVDQVIEFLDKTHPYDTPCIIKLGAEASDAFGAWLKS